MGITSTTDGDGITTVTVDYPPVNAIPSRAGSSWPTPYSTRGGIRTPTWCS